MTLFQKLAGFGETGISAIGAGLMILQVINGGDGLGQIGAALMALVAPVCAAIRDTRGGSEQALIEAVAEAVRTALGR